MQQFRENLTEVIGQVQYAKNPVVVTNHRRQAVAVIPFEHLAVLEAALERLADAHAGAEAMSALNDPTDEVSTYVPRRLRQR
jgi:prevent-host-death family protein